LNLSINHCVCACGEFGRVLANYITRLNSSVFEQFRMCL
jgi:hypothetical protein